MVMPVLFFSMSPSRRSLLIIGFDAQVIARPMQRRGEVTVSVGGFLVCALEREIEREIIVCAKAGK